MYEIDIDNLSLLYGDDYYINKYITVKHPTVREIKEFGELNYYTIIQPFVLTPEDLMVEYDDIGVNYMKVDQYHTFIDLLIVAMKSKVDFTWLLGCSLSSDEFIVLKSIENGEPIVTHRKNGDIIIDKLVYYRISNFIKKINNVQLTNRYTPANETTRKVLIKEERKKSKKKRKKPSYTAKLVSALAWKNTGGIQMLNVWDLHIYQVFDGIMMISKIDRANNLLQGIYSGAVDSKKINTNELNWMSNN